MGLPGEKTADTFFQSSLLLLVATGFLAVVSTGRLDRPTAALAGAALVARALMINGWMTARLTPLALKVITIAYIGFFPFDLLYISGTFLGATVHMVFFLAVIKLLTAATGRDYLFLSLIALLEVLSAAMLTSSAAILGFLALFLVFAVAARTRYEIQSNGERAEHRASNQPPSAGSIGWKLAALSAALAAGIAVMGLGLFFVVPRAAGAYLSRLPPTGESVLGYSGEEIVLGTSGRIRNDNTPVLRVKILEGRRTSNLKWRGGTLRYFDGVRWSNPPSPARVLDSAQGHYLVGRMRSRVRPAPGSFLRYRVLRAPMDCDTVFLPGTPQILEGDFGRMEVSEADAISVPGSRWRPLRYEGWSFIGPARPAESSDLEGPFQTRIRSRYLQLPQLDSGIPALAHHITETESSPYSRAAAIEQYLKTHLDYTLELPSEPPADPLANFLFERKKGHCEYFASAMAIMLRTISIPSRVADGFQSGPYNTISGYYTVRASEAHAWVEAYFAGLGWVTFDPTPAEPLPEGLLGRSWQYLDALETFWSDWIVQYDLSRQASLARSIQIEWYKAAFQAIEHLDRGANWAASHWERWKQAPVRALTPILEMLAGFLAGGLVIWSAPRLRTWFVAHRVRRGLGRDQDCALLYLRALEQMERRGFVRRGSQTPHEFARAVQPPKCPEPAARLLARITLAYEHSRFGGDRGSARELPELIQALEALPR